MEKQLIITLDNEHEVEETVEEVLRQIKKGYKSGISPEWKIEDSKKVKFF